MHIYVYIPEKISLISGQKTEKFFNDNECKFYKLFCDLHDTNVNCFFVIYITNFFDISVNLTDFFLFKIHCKICYNKRILKKFLLFKQKNE